MAVCKLKGESSLISGSPNKVIELCKAALEKGAFTKINFNARISQLESKFKKATCVGDILVTLFPEGQSTKVIIKATANVDNVFALFSSPTAKIIGAFNLPLSTSDERQRGE